MWAVYKIGKTQRVSKKWDCPDGKSTMQAGQSRLGKIRSDAYVLVFGSLIPKFPGHLKQPWPLSLGSCLSDVFLCQFQNSSLLHQAARWRTVHDRGRTPVFRSSGVDSSSFALPRWLRYQADHSLPASAWRGTAGLAGLHHAWAGGRTPGRGQEDGHQEGLPVPQLVFATFYHFSHFYYGLGGGPRPVGRQ